jgi:hypothetical protein
MDEELRVNWNEDTPLKEHFRGILMSELERDSMADLEPMAARIVARGALTKNEMDEILWEWRQTKYSRMSPEEIQQMLLRGEGLIEKYQAKTVIRQKSRFVGIIRNLLVIPLCFTAIGLAYWGIGQIFNWIARIDSFPVILLSLILFGVIGWAIFMLFSVNLVALISRIAPNPKIAIGTVSVISTLFCLYSIISIWTTPIQYSATMIFCGIVFTLMSLKLAFNLVDGAKHVNTSRLA